jgi:hypothetical protein
MWGQIANVVSPPDNPAAQATGILTVGALLAASAGLQRETLPEAAGSTVLAILLVWLTHAYEASGECRTGRAFLVALRHEFPLLWGASFPLVVLLLFGLSGARDSVAVTAELVTAAVLLVTVEVVASLRVTGRVRPVQMVVSLALGAGVFLLKLVAH